MMIKLPPRTEKVWRFLCYLKNCFNSKIYTIFPLTLLNFTPYDSIGEYVCKAKNELGEDIVKCKLVCKELPAIQLENQVPKGMKKSEYLMQMEASMKKYAQEIMLTEDDVYDIEKRQPPR